VQCLYCGKGIGPIRQIRGASFCSEAHRNKFRDIYRQEAYEALAPAPAPSKCADFIERTPAAAGPAPHSLLRLLTKHFSGPRQPAMHVEAAGVWLERPGWVNAQALAGMPTRLAWQSTAATHALPVWSASPPMHIASADWPVAGAAPTLLETGPSIARPLVAAARAHQLAGPLPHTAWLPAAARATTPAKAGPHRLQAAIAAVPPVAHAAALPASTTTIAQKAAFDQPASARQAGITPAAIAAEPRPLEAGPLMLQAGLKTPVDNAVPVAFDPFGNRHIGIMLPKAPAAAAASSTWITALRRARTARLMQAEQPLSVSQTGPAINLPELPSAPAIKRSLQLAPMAQKAAPQEADVPAASPAWQAARADARIKAMAQFGKPAQYSAAPSGALAGLIEAASSPVQQAAGAQNPRTAAALPLRAEMPAAPHAMSALPGATVSAELCEAKAPAPAAPSTAVLSWDDTRAAANGHASAPLADFVLSPIDWRPAPAAAFVGSAVPLPPVVGRSVRSCAVLWTLRVIHLCNPRFRMEPVRPRFSDLLRADQSMQYSRDLEDVRPVKNNLRVMKREAAPRSPRSKWQYIGMAAAVVLLAGSLRLLAPVKGTAASLPWRGVGFRQWMSQRATRNFTDDFRAGLNQWKGVQAKWPKNWSYNTDGFIHPGQLALYRPSVPLSDYRFEFMAQIENKSVDWVVRAHDGDNYYALKFAVVEPGPRPIVAMVRYPVIEGHRGERVETPVRLMIHANTPYRVTVDVKGNRYHAYIEGQETDLWTEDRLKTGGVGFFSEAGEHARVYWVKLESHGDILGRICGLLSGNGSRATGRETQAMDFVPNLFENVALLTAPQIRRP
jgi:hypothetical protein